MSTTESQKTMTTYLINNGSFSGNIIFDLHLPTPVGFTYVFTPEVYYNISKMIGGNAVNAICFFMRKSIRNEIPLSKVADTTRNFNFKSSDLVNHASAIGFDSSKNDAYIIVIHNHDFDLDLVNDCFNNLADHVNDVHINSSPKIIDLGFVPRKLGVSIIRR